MAGPAHSHQAFFEAAARLVEGRSAPDSEMVGHAKGLLAAIGYEVGAAGLETTEGAARARLLRVGTRLERIFQLETSVAPGLRFFGAEVSPATIEPTMAGEPSFSPGGAGLSTRQALEGCLGEAAEYLGQVRGPSSDWFRADMRAIGAAVPSAWRSWLEVHLGRDDHEVDFLWAAPLGDGPPLPVPVDLCLRRPAAVRQFAPQVKLSTGCAAGSTLQAAQLHALLELVERDAAALWWRGGCRGRALSLDDLADGQIIEMLTALRGDVRRRRTMLLDISTELGVPTVAAISSDTSGVGFACGLAARWSLSEAARSALIELAQMELAQEIADAKARSLGEKALTALDRSHLRRARHPRCDAFDLLQPKGSSRHFGGLRPVGIDASLSALIEALSRAGMRAYWIDLTHPLVGIPVVRVVVPDLQPEPAEFDLPRLTAASQEGGGGSGEAQGIPLLV